MAGFQKTTDRPTLIIVRSVIAWRRPNKHNTHGAHGAPLGEEEVRLTKRAYGWPEDQKFLVPDEVPAHFRANIGARGQGLRQAWETRYAEYARQFPEQAKELDLIERHELPAGWDAEIKPFAADAKGHGHAGQFGQGAESDRQAVAVAGGRVGRPGPLDAHAHGRRRRFRGRQATAAAICTSASASMPWARSSTAWPWPGCGPFGATFFVFSDYMRPSIRMAAIMGLPVFYVFTHDSIGVGEDGPTHQPIEHLAALRAIPNLTVIRPGDANEVAEAYRSALLNTKGPTALVLSRQNLPTLDRGKYAPAAGAARAATCWPMRPTASRR